ncbi:hypothetical protein SDRG_14966 [Saprolegnia diclina VS20]|uniref:Amino acid transporter transmembrane domain-containing protein n=1 Tax=Saprolegnia diclina (strain VS20) TaxID=1156394 RepID=T0PYC8_SAPDV|nr:hypothetical protein SDRG_14966 [Saprolegnia diclina VS20]EQC27251.1 hypothetical protein SDRG_14966 [Saprolegnia diclina VS20]|eukprot:XP_008619350.1 hypothetical protein SDRG_14966 [Saprolegnia diclina VS20]
MLIDNMSTPEAKNLSTPSPDLSFSGVTAVFGNLALAYGAGVVIPALQREHSDPTRMPRVIVVTLVSISVLFMVLAITGVSVVGCQIPGNLLFAVNGDKLGFKASRGGVILAFLFMQLHITIAFSLILYPALFIMERIILGMHKSAFVLADVVDEEAKESAFAVTETPNEATNADLAKVHDATAEHDSGSAAAYNAPGAYLKVCILRTVVVAIMVVVALLWKDNFTDLVDFVGASSTSTSCMILPIVFYLKTFHATLSKPEKAFAILCVLVTTCLAVYVSYTTGKHLFAPGQANPAIKFPYCPAEYQQMVYTNTTFYSGKKL